MDAMQDLQEAIYADLCEIRDNDHSPIPLIDAALVSSAWRWAPPRDGETQRTPGNAESVRFYAIEIRRIRNSIFGRHPNPLGLSKVESQP